MTRKSRKLLAGAALAGLLASAGSGPLSSALAQDNDPMVPWFQVDPLWPNPLPNHGVLPMPMGLSMDAKDNVWILHRPQPLEQKESYAPRNEADCCPAAPDVLEFDPAGNLLRHWGRDQ